MEYKLEVFTNPEGLQLRTHTDMDGVTWFCAKDIATALDYSQAGSITTLFGNVPDIWKGSKPIATPGGEQDMLCLTEQGVYFFLGRSDKPNTGKKNSDGTPVRQLKWNSDVLDVLEARICKPF